MLIIFSERNDVLTIRVLSMLRCRYVVIYKDNILTNIKIIINNPNSEPILFFNDKLVDLSKITHVWHRKGYINFGKFYQY